MDESLAAAGEEMPDHYIYVAYPPELKRRLLERYKERRLCFKSSFIRPLEKF